MKNEQAVGEWIWYYANGKKELEGSFYTPEKINKTCIIDTTVFEDDFYSESIKTFWHYSKPHGKWTKYNTDGSVYKIIMYDKGRVIKEEVISPKHY